MSKLKEQKEYICKPGSKKNLLICSLKIKNQSAKHLHEPVKMLFKRTYWNERPNLHKIFDILGIIFATFSIAILIYLLIPRHAPEYIDINAMVAPSEVVTGGSSTLSFHYQNNSDETLENVRLYFDFPEHFLIQEYILNEGEAIPYQEFSLPDIPPDGRGTVKVKGTMFGDIGGEQIFTTNFSYKHGENQEPEEQVNQHIFSPTSSTLALELVLPEYLVENQMVEGKILYKNTGNIDFPSLQIETILPENFTLLSSNPSLENETFFLSPIEAGEIGEIDFTGLLGSSDHTFTFHPFFQFDEILYRQEILQDTIGTLPSPIEISHSIQESILEPGGYATVNFVYQNIGEDTVKDMQLQISSNDDIFATSNIQGGYYQNNLFQSTESFDVNPGETGIYTMRLPIKSSLPAYGRNSYQNIVVTTQSSAIFDFIPTGGEQIPSNTFGTTTELQLSSPIILQSFGRYYTASGDQLGRGPLPPIVEETTKYWIFWNISGTTNDLNNVEIRANLGPDVSLTGRQSIAYGSPITQNGNEIIWTIDHIEPTLPPENPIIGIAFEVQITPSFNQINTNPILLEAPVVTANDAFTGGFVSSNGILVTTDLIYDEKAQTYGSFVAEN